jgi:ABC-type transport system substrate-binding protein
MDLSEREEIYAKIQRIAWNDAPWLFLHRQVAFMAHRSDIKGIFRQPGIQLALFWMAYR